MKNLINLALFIAVFSLHAVAQTKVANQGTILFEKKINNYAILKEIYANDPEGPANFENYKQKNPQFEEYFYKLSFNGSSTLYQPAEQLEIKSPIGQSTSNNIVFTDYSSGKFSSQKKIFNKQYVLKDTVRSIKWKLTTETREIAGYRCKRANGLLMDSIYVVAFYATDVISNGGPELFNGLPGMILGLAIPAEHVTWFATKVTVAPVQIKESDVPTTGIPYNLTEFQTFLNTLTRLGPVKKNVIKNALF
ncbi:GLPGLI family protein [Pedobacter sp. Du54]|uniref:GLPGLI family protein n=1 Tax=Pedobacter anseongensis TaxID=3133439 RepID=UPI0030B5C9C8